MARNTSTLLMMAVINTHQNIVHKNFYLHAAKKTNLRKTLKILTDNLTVEEMVYRGNCFMDDRVGKPIKIGKAKRGMKGCKDLWKPKKRKPNQMPK